MSSIHFEKEKAPDTYGPSRKRCHTCCWRREGGLYICDYAQQNSGTVLGTMKERGLQNGAPCPCYKKGKAAAGDEHCFMDKAVAEDVKRAKAVKEPTEKQKEKERRAKEAQERREQRNAQRMELYRQGCSDGVIAKAVGCSPNTIIKWRQDRDLPPNFTKGGRRNRHKETEEKTEDEKMKEKTPDKRADVNPAEPSRAEPSRAEPSRAEPSATRPSIK